MTERNPPVWMQSGTYNAVDDRMVTALLSDRTTSVDGQTFSVEGGVLPPVSQLQVTANNTMSLSISTGTIIIPSSGTNPPGAYICHNDGVKTIAMDIESSSNPRVDFIYAEAEDIAAGGTTSVWRIAVKKGNPSANPTNPPLGPNQIPLAGIRVIPASQNGGVNKITPTQVYDYRRFAASLGGVHLRYGTASLTPEQSPGRLLYDVPNGNFFISDGSQWNRLLTTAQTEWFNAVYRPVHASGVGGGILTSNGANNQWLPYLFAPNGGTTPNPPLVVWSQSPSGKFKVTLTIRGQMNPFSTATQVYYNPLYATVKGFNTAGAEVFSGNTSWAAARVGLPQMPQTTSVTFMADTPGSDQSIKFQVFWYFQVGTMGSGDFVGALTDMTYLLVEPIR